MGAGASAQESSKVMLEKDLASRENQGQKLGAEYEVTLLRPQLQGVKVNQKYVLRVAYEALVLTAMDDAKTPVTYFKYQDIICWGSSSYNFQFKVFGAAMGQSEPVAVGFKTALGVGKELEKVTLSSVLSLMSDMEKVAVSKEEFEALKDILSGSKTKTFVAPPTAHSDNDSSSNGNSENNTNEGGNKDDDDKKPVSEASDIASAADAAMAPPPPILPPPQREQADDTAAASGGASASETMDDGSNDSALGMGEFFSTVKQVAMSRLFTVHQATAIMKWSKSESSGMDAFDRMDLAVFLWHAILSPDSFQLILNTFDELADRENLIARISASGKNRASVKLLRPECPDAGGGVLLSTAKNGTRCNADSTGDYRIQY